MMSCGLGVYTPLFNTVMARFHPENFVLGEGGGGLINVCNKKVYMCNLLTNSLFAYIQEHGHVSLTNLL